MTHKVKSLSGAITYQANCNECDYKVDIYELRRFSKGEVRRLARRHAATEGHAITIETTKKITYHPIVELEEVVRVE